MESGRITLPVWMCLPTGSSPNPTEASPYRHDQTFNSIFRFSPFSKEVCVWGGGGRGYMAEIPHSGVDLPTSF